MVGSRARSARISDPGAMRSAGMLNDPCLRTNTLAPILMGDAGPHQKPRQTAFHNRNLSLPSATSSRSRCDTPGPFTLRGKANTMGEPSTDDDG
jgi:hypothetical protein